MMLAPSSVEKSLIINAKVNTKLIYNQDIRNRENMALKEEKNSRNNSARILANK